MSLSTTGVNDKFNTSISTVPIDYNTDLPYLNYQVPADLTVVNAPYLNLNLFNFSGGNNLSSHLNQLLSNVGGSAAYFQSLTNSSTPLPTNIYDFVTTIVIASYAPAQITKLCLYGDFYNVYNNTGDPAWATLTPPLNDYDLNAPLGSFPGLYVPGSNPFPPLTNSQVQFEAWFNGLLAANKDPSQFLNEFSKALTKTAMLSSGSSPYNGVPLPTYQGVYQEFFPNATTQAFYDELQVFYTEQVEKTGFFNPSLAFNKWVDQVEQDYNQAKGVTPLLDLKSNLATSDFDATSVLNRIFSLVYHLIDTLQRVASVQSNNLALLTKWQTAYTNSLQQFHTFLNTPGDSTSGDGRSSTLDQQHRDQMNTDINTNLRQLVQTFQSTISDTAKAMQSSINQSSDAVSQQANLATALIQELSGLLTAIYR